MPITDPEAIRFVNEEVRPAAERLRDVIGRIRMNSAEWFAGMNTTITNTADVVEDGRENEGVSRLTGVDVHNFMAIWLGVDGGTGNDQTIEKPTVRGPDV